MRCSSLGFAVFVALSLVAGGCDSTSDDEAFSGAGSGGSIAPAPAGMSGGGAGRAGGGGAAGMVVDNAPNMPEAMCHAMEGGGRCAACACTPNAMGGCLTEQENCYKNHTDPMANTLCLAVLKCARDMKCTGMSCIGPCTAQITAAAMYGIGNPMGGAGGGGAAGMGGAGGGAAGMSGAGGMSGGGGMSAGAGGRGGSGGNMAFVAGGAGGRSGAGGMSGAGGSSGVGGAAGSAGAAGASGAGGMSGGGAGAGGRGMMGPNSLMAATASGMCTTMKCAGACP